MKFFFHFNDISNQYNLYDNTEKTSSRREKYSSDVKNILLIKCNKKFHFIKWNKKFHFIKWNKKYHFIKWKRKLHLLKCKKKFRYILKINVIKLMENV